jgi:hypothetical protein
MLSKELIKSLADLHKVISKVVSLLSSTEKRPNSVVMSGTERKS